MSALVIHLPEYDKNKKESERGENFQMTGFHSPMETLMQTSAAQGQHWNYKWGSVVFV